MGAIIAFISNLMSLLNKILDLFRKSTQEKVDEKNDIVDQEIKKSDETGRP